MRSVFLPEEVVGHHVLSAVWIAVRLDHTTVTGGLLHIKFYLHIKIWLLFPSLAVAVLFILTKKSLQREPKSAFISGYSHLSWKTRLKVTTVFPPCRKTRRLATLSLINDSMEPSSELAERTSGRFGRSSIRCKSHSQTRARRVTLWHCVALSRMWTGATSTCRSSTRTW